MKFINLLFATSAMLFACSNPEQEKLQAKVDETDCKADFLEQNLKTGMNTILLGQSYGLDKAYDDWNKASTDTTISCDSLKAAWEKYANIVHEKSKQ